MAPAIAGGRAAQPLSWRLSITDVIGQKSRVQGFGTVARLWQGLRNTQE